MTTPLTVEQQTLQNKWNLYGENLRYIDKYKNDLIPVLTTFGIGFSSDLLSTTLGPLSRDLTDLNVSIADFVNTLGHTYKIQKSILFQAKICKILYIVFGGAFISKFFRPEISVTSSVYEGTTQTTYGVHIGKDLIVGIKDFF
ncbi:hypothetical protein DLAC_11672 [Tieghemostelium lacteum]|uniref:Uncharacterized protein n=1 Tax=Tieghemostelium lacteum TaxID=361077 RepID=A0A151ZDT1_TIELA|nr:hypothetical protein DLAC_11672 [Tieghemostelium lacteum]|eukprot:KYQ92116.1 hypothetical protein DLAC_11672 [Tieghemostelium lacteum]